MSEGTITTDAVVERTKTTMEAFERLIASPEAERRLELIDGEIAEKAMPIQEHAQIADEVSGLIRPFLKVHHPAYMGAEIRYKRLEDQRNSLLPDWSFQFKTDQSIVTRGAVPAMPDFVLEVQSPDDSIADMRKKAGLYLTLGTRLVWLALPRRKVILSYWADGSEDVHTVEDTFDFRDLLPGFTIAVRDIFAF